jgi:hypothetical protein
MTTTTFRFVEKAGVTLSASLLAAAMFFPLAASAQDTPKSGSSQISTVSNHDRWLHVRVTNPSRNEEKVLPTINKNRLHSGRVKFDDIDCHGVDLRALVDAVRTSKDGEFVTVQNRDSDVRVAKRNGTLFVHVFEKNKPRRSEVEVKVPMKVVDALFSGDKDELDLVAGLRALSAQGDTELVSVKDDENTVRVWLDSKNITD